MKCALLIISCDNYSDLWAPMINSIENSWPDCPLEKFIVTNKKKISLHGFNSIEVGKDKGWSSGVLLAISKLEEKYDYVLTTIEDTPLSEKVNTEKFINLFNSFIKDKGHFLSLTGRPSPNKKYNSLYGMIIPKSKYRANCVFGIWKIDSLKSMLSIEENAWEFETNIIERSKHLSGFYSVNKSFFTYLHIVNRGKFINVDLWKAKRIGINYENTKRRKMNFIDEIIFLFKVNSIKIMKNVGMIKNKK